MTLVDLAVLGGSAAVIAFMLGVAVLLGFRRSARISEDDLAAQIANAEPGAKLDVAAIDTEGRAALARLHDGRFVAAQVMGDRVSLRVFSSGAELRRAPDGLSVRFADLGFPSLHLKLKEEPSWLADFPGRGVKP